MKCEERSALNTRWYNFHDLNTSVVHVVPMGGIPLSKSRLAPERVLHGRCEAALVRDQSH
jgi:hypothetical protein